MILCSLTAFPTSTARPRMKSIVVLAHVQVGDVSVDFSRGNVGVAQKRLYRTRISAVLHQVRAKGVTQSVRRDVRHARLSSIRLNDRPGSLPRHLPATMQEQLGLAFVTQSAADSQITLEPAHGALTDRNTALFASFPMTGQQRCVDVDVARL